MADPTPNDENAAPPLRRVDDLLTPEDEANLRRDLARMAKQRRDAAAFAAGYVMGASGSGAE